MRVILKVKVTETFTMTTAVAPIVRVPKTVSMTVAEIVTVTDSVTQCPSDSDKDG